MLPNQYYDKVKILYKLSKLCWFIEQHAKVDAQNNPDELARLSNLQKDLDTHITAFKKALNS